MNPYLSNLFVPPLVHRKVLQFKSGFVSLIKDCNVGTILATLCLLIARRHAMGVDVNLHFNINTVLKGKKKTLQMKMSKFVSDSFGECKKRTYFRTSCCLQYVSKSL